MRVWRKMWKFYKEMKVNSTSLKFSGILHQNIPQKQTKVLPPHCHPLTRFYPQLQTLKRWDLEIMSIWDLLESSQGELCDEEAAFDTETNLSEFCKIRMRKVSERTLNIMLMEMRKLDRDRERIIHSSTLDNLVQKYKLPISPCLSKLKQMFEDETLPGFTNYEHLVR